MQNIIILDDMSYLRYRVREILTKKDINVYECDTSFDFFNKFFNDKIKFDLVILEVGLTKEDGYSIIDRIRKRDKNIPILILTKVNSRNGFAKVIKHNVNDYVLKPFENKFLVDRVLKLLDKNKTNDNTQQNIQKTQIHNNKIKQVESNEKNSIIPKEFRDYFMKQLEIAKTNNKKMSAMVFTLIKNFSQDEKVEVNEGYLLLTEAFYKGIKSIFKEPDFLTKQGLFTFLSVLPNCDEEKVNNVKQKMEEKYKMLCAIYSKLEEYHITTKCVTYPDDGQEIEELMKKLEQEMKTAIVNEK